MVEETAIRVQARVYHRLVEIRAHLPDDSWLDALEHFMAPLISVSAFDLGPDRLPGFASYRFPSARLLGAHLQSGLYGMCLSVRLDLGVRFLLKNNKHAFTTIYKIS